MQNLSFKYSISQSAFNQESELKAQIATDFNCNMQCWYTDSVAHVIRGIMQNVCTYLHYSRTQCLVLLVKWELEREEAIVKLAQTVYRCKLDAKV